MLRVFLFLLFSISAMAQSSTTGSITGTVLDPSNAVVANARVTVVNTGTGEQSSTITGMQGEFRMVSLEPGTYSVTVEALTFAGYKAQVVVEVGRVTGLEAVLSLASRPVTVEVTSVPVVNTQQQDFSNNVGELSINELPINGRRWSNFALLTPGAAPDGNFGLISFRGISGLLNNSTVDGGDNNQAFFSEERGRTRASYVVSQASVREFQVNTSNFSAEYGRAAGAVINSVTKSGTNELHGQLFYYIRDNELGATNPFSFAPTRDPSGSLISTRVKPQDRRQQFGAAFGGPIIKDKLFYFFTWDQQKRNFPAIAAASQPTDFYAPPTNTELTRLKAVLPKGATTADAQAAWNQGMTYLTSFLGVAPRTGDQLILFPRLDYEISDRHTLMLSYNRVRWSSPTGVQSQPVVNRGIASFGNDGVKVDSFVTRLVSTFGNSISNELRFSYGRDFEYELPQAPAPGEPTTGPFGNSPSISVASASMGFTFGMPSSLPRAALPDERRVQIADTVTWMKGKHLIKAGFDVSRVSDFMDNLYNTGGSYYYSYVDSFIADYTQWQHWNDPAYLKTNRGYSSFSRGFGDSAWKFRTLDVAYYLQDDWRAFPTVTLSFGLRYEKETLPAVQAANPLIPQTQKFPSDGNNFGPRVGFAWDIFGDGRTSLRGGYGLYYGRISNSTISSALNNTGIRAAQRAYTFCSTVSSTCLAQGPIFPAVPAADPFDSGNGGGDVAYFSPTMQNPQIQQADLVLEREVAPNTVISASYLLSLGRELPNFIDQNLDPASLQNVTYKFGPDYYGNHGPFDGQTLTVPVVTRRLNPNFEQMTQITSNVNSSYNALVLQMNRRMTKGLQFRLNYTWSHSLDNGQNSQTFVTGNNTVMPFPLTYTLNGKTVTLSNPDYGSSTFDMRQRLTASFFWIPSQFRNSGRIIKAVLDNWAIAPVIHISTGRAFTEYIGGNAPIDTCPACLGFMGTNGVDRLPFLSRNSFRFPNTQNVDLRLSKRFYLGEKRRIEFMAEAFNVFNHMNVTDLNDELYYVSSGVLTYSRTFGTPSAAGNTLFRERQIQFALRYEF